MEKSCGLIIFRKSSSIEYLLLNSSGCWSFPKGHMEFGESELETALRETKEETSLIDLELVPNFYQKIDYTYKNKDKNVEKSVIFFLAKLKSGKVTISQEHSDYCWLPYTAARKRLSFENAKKLLVLADSCISK